MIPVDLRADGVLWLINRVVFHPRGFALAIDGESGAFSLIWDGTECGTFTAEGDDESFAAVEALMARARVENRKAEA